MSTELNRTKTYEAETYSKDFYSWVVSQTEALVELREFVSRQRFDGKVDWDHLIEEVEDLANQKLDAIAILMENVIGHLLYIESRPTDTACQGWLREITNWRMQIRRLIAKNPGTTHSLNDEFILSAWNDGVEMLIRKFAETKQERRSLSSTLLDNIHWSAAEICDFNLRLRAKDLPKFIEPSLPDKLVSDLIEAGASWKYPQSYSSAQAE